MSLVPFPGNKDFSCLTGKITTNLCRYILANKTFEISKDNFTHYMLLRELSEITCSKQRKQNLVVL